ncbi:SDR family oxidoreductase [Liquorilactobacillus satsumensis]|uniref:SDR family oxidoreductase n=1 Tax=Liquorilactobacillus satsumensis TaxID=259059 RepID=UPI0021C324A7|nr:SDR family oxidoreductase [Liquorilactobacillus satsumensis]MCP9329295.1 SDR family oxidoreductase [Liquorilactobacillus satsumensis]
MKYGVTAATGKFGRTALTDLIKIVGKDQVVAFARNLEKAKKVLPAGIEVRQADYTDAAGLRTAFAGIERLLFISSVPGNEYPRDKQHLNVVKAATAAKIDFIAYTSFPHAETANSPLAADHQKTEHYLEESGLKYAFLRNNWYLENQAGLIKEALAGKPFRFSAGDGRVGWALEREYAEAAVKVLTSVAPKKIYEFAGPSRSFGELASELKQFSEKEFEVESLSDAEYRKTLEAEGLGAAADVIIMIQTLIRDGELTEETNDLLTVLGHALTPLAEAVKEL